MTKEKVEVPTIKIDDVDYAIDEISDDAKAQLQGVQVAEAEMKRLNVQIALAQTARNAYMQALNAALPEAV